MQPGICGADDGAGGGGAGKLTRDPEVRVALDMRYLCGVEYLDMTQRDKAEAFGWHASVLRPALDGLAAIPALMSALAGRR